MSLEKEIKKWKGKLKDLVFKLKPPEEDPVERARRIRLDSFKHHYRLGKNKQELNDLDGAVAEYVRALKYEPTNVDSLHRIGKIKMQQEAWETAIHYLDRALRLDPDHLTAYFDRGYAKAKLGDEQGQHKDYEKGLELNPNMNAATSLVAASRKKEQDILDAFDGKRRK